MVTIAGLMQALSIKNLTKTYANGNQALKGINFSVEAGDFYALLGPNGAGKTTAIGIITSLVNKSGGDVEIFGHNIENELEAAKTCIGLVPQEVNLNLWEGVHNIVLNQAGYYGLDRKLARERAEKYLRALRLWDRRNDSARSLSGGMKRRLMIVRALVHEPKRLILDEPTAGVDVELRRDMWEMVRELREGGVTIILTTHYIDEAEEMADRIGVMSNGEIILVEDKDTLIHKLGKKQLTLHLQQPLTSIPGDLGDQPLELSEDGTEIVYTFDAQEEHTGIAALLRKLNAHGVEFKDVQSSQSSLEEIFVNLVKEER